MVWIYGESWSMVSIPCNHMAIITWPHMNKGALPSYCSGDVGATIYVTNMRLPTVGVRHDQDMKSLSINLE